MVYDCSKIKDFEHEWNRRRKMIPTVYAPFDSLYGSTIGDKSVIEDLQEWSDNNLEMTRLEKFSQFMEELGLHVFVDFKNNCPTGTCIDFDSCEECIKWWKEVV